MEWYVLFLINIWIKTLWYDTWGNGATLQAKIAKYQNRQIFYKNQTNFFNQMKQCKNEKCNRFLSNCAKTKMKTKTRTPVFLRLFSPTKFLFFFIIQDCSFNKNRLSFINHLTFVQCKKLFCQQKNESQIENIHLKENKRLQKVTIYFNKTFSRIFFKTIWSEKIVFFLLRKNKNKNYWRV